MVLQGVLYSKNQSMLGMSKPRAAISLRRVGEWGWVKERGIRSGRVSGRLGFVGRVWWGRGMG